MAVSIALVFTGYALLVIRFFKKNAKSGGLSVYGTIGLFCSSALAAQYALTVYNQDNIGVSAATVFCLIFLPAAVLTLLRIVGTAFIKPKAKLSVKALIPRVLYTAVFCAIFTFFPRHSFYSNFEGRWHYTVFGDECVQMYLPVVLTLWFLASAFARRNERFRPFRLCLYAAAISGVSSAVMLSLSLQKLVFAPSDINAFLLITVDSEKRPLYIVGCACLAAAVLAFIFFFVFAVRALKNKKIKRHMIQTGKQTVSWGA